MHKGLWMIVGMLALGALSGCGASSPTGEGTADAGASPAPPEAVGAPRSLVRGKYALLRDAARLYLSENWEAALDFNPPPKPSFEFSDLPETFKPPYRVRGWEKGSNSFGVLLYEGRVALAMIQNDRGTPEDLGDLVLRYEKTYGPAKMVPGSKVNYWFWNDETARMMICGLKKKDVVKITVALGDEVPCEALGISLEMAERDRAKVDAKVLADEGEPARK